MTDTLDDSSQHPGDVADSLKLVAEDLLKNSNPLWRALGERLALDATALNACVFVDEGWGNKKPGDERDSVLLSLSTVISFDEH